jgi:hypothetical protein
MEALPGVVEHIDTDLLVHILLVVVLGRGAIGSQVTVFLRLKAVMTPERIIEGILLFLLRVSKISDGGLLTIHTDSDRITLTIRLHPHADTHANLNS